jgi:hypothetical protein
MWDTVLSFIQEVTGTPFIRRGAPLRGRWVPAKYITQFAMVFALCWFLTPRAERRPYWLTVTLIVAAWLYWKLLKRYGHREIHLWPFSRSQSRHRHQARPEPQPHR